MRAPDGTAYQLDGTDAAPMLALIHGLGLCRHMWQAHLTALAARYRVLTYDLYGHGDSAPLPAPASLGLYADQLARLLDTVGEDRAAVVGFSIGGMINRRFALDHGDRLSALVILNSPHDRGAEAQALVEARAARVRADGPMATLDAALERWFTHDFRQSRPDVMDRVRQWRAQAHPESYAQAAWVLAHGVRELIAPNRAIPAPTLVMTCQDDSGSTPTMSHAIASQIAGSQTIIVPRLKHLGLLENPQAFTAPILDFLERTLR